VGGIGQVDFAGQDQRDRFVAAAGEHGLCGGADLGELADERFVHGRFLSFSM
jgi:hypothetical protein